MAIYTKVVGVTYDNPDGKNRQDIIKGLTAVPPFSGQFPMRVMA